MRRYGKYLLYITIGAALVQALIILYNDYTGYSAVESLPHFGIKLLAGTLLSVPMVAVVLLMDARIIRIFDARLSWQRAMSRRIPLEIAAALLAGILVGIGITLLSELLFGYREPLGSVLVTNALISAVVNLLLMAALQSVLFYKQHQESLLKAEQLERENIAMRFEVLKKQLDPHFLFNSLNVLSSLIRTDRDRAQDFVDEFSAIYRYTLEVIDKPVVTVREELNFARSYLYLQHSRFAEAVTAEFAVDERQMNLLVPPLAVQTLLENAFKHNIASEDRPLHIRIFSRENALLVVNNLQRKAARRDSRGVGFENLKHRYRLISGKSPEVLVTGEEYTVKLPLIEPEQI